MKQTEKVSIGGYSFILERDAYERLNGYIEDIRATYSSNTYASEIMGDIEQRIAELFIEKGGKAGIVDSRDRKQTGQTRETHTGRTRAMPGKPLQGGCTGTSTAEYWAGSAAA